jgi:arabinofuranosyltransferase
MSPSEQPAFVSSDLRPALSPALGVADRRSYPALAATAAAAIVILSAAWLSDDAYITLRVIDNFWNGYGLRWNVIERVQVFTHPLWLLVLGCLYGLTRESYWTILALSLSLSLGTLYLTARWVAAGGATLFALAVAVSSKSFVDFSTSGLENPMSHFLLVALLLAGWRGAAGSERDWPVSTIAGLCVLCRLDLILMAGPLWLASQWRRNAARDRSLRRWMSAFAIFAFPTTAWMMFAWWYYGSPVPNTALAKLPTNWLLDDRVEQGLHYLWDAVIADPITPLATITAFALVLIKRQDRAIAIALIAYLSYVVFVGGDFMTGRFLSPVFALSLGAIARHIRWSSTTGAVAAGVVLAVTAAFPQARLRIWQQPVAGAPPHILGRGIVDERAFFYPQTGLVAVLGGSRPAQHSWASAGASLKPGPRVIVYPAVGLIGYHAGPGIHIVDRMALTDPLLATLPANLPARVGHMERTIPEGYLETVAKRLVLAFPNGAIAPGITPMVTSPRFENHLRPADIARRYDRIALMTQAPLAEPTRVRRLLRGGLHDLTGSD